MTTIEQDIRDAHALVWDVRGRIGHLWPTPGPGDALLFALTELGEAVDAHLRSQPQYNRNRDKTLSVEDELADCAIMLLTALGEGWEMQNCIEPQGQFSPEEIFARLCRNIGQQLGVIQEFGRQDYQYFTESALCWMFAVWFGDNAPLADLVWWRLERIERRVMGGT